MRRNPRALIDPDDVRNGCWVPIHEDKGYANENAMIAGRPKYPNVRGLPASPSSELRRRELI